jgi:hypothetical protein
MKLGKILILAVLLLGCGKNELGEGCDKSGDPDECEDGTMCGKESSGANVCLKTCVADTDCPSDRACNGTEGTNVKICRLKTVK